MTDMTGKVALVTGGASGMGRIIALRLAARGAKVAIFDLNEQGLSETAAEAEGLTPFTCDISNNEDVEVKVAQVTEQLGPIDHLVHAAALMPGHKLVDETHESMERLFRINYFGTTYMVKAVLPSMIARKAGRIIAFGSIAGHALVPNMGAYCATKSAVNTYIEVLQNEIRDTGVRVHLICPPAVNTPLIDQTIATDAPGSIRESKEKGRLADPEKIVDAIDKGIAKDKDIIYPAEAWFLMVWKILFPKLWWKTVLSFDK
jgi:NAD(P)-dependent dehydrogenase (short-subunit alcohol dehydrogenase family)